MEWKELKELESMARPQIAGIALKQFINFVNITEKDLEKHPIQIDQNNLLWLFNSDLGKWISILGNVSELSPKEKLAKEIRYLETLNDLNLENEFWSNLRKKILLRDGNKCTECGKDSNLHAHHIVPKSIGGTDYEDNLITLCNSCHRKAEYKEFDKSTRTYLKEVYENTKQNDK